MQAKMGLIMLLTMVSAESSAVDWRACVTVEDVVRDYPERLSLLFAALDSAHPGVADACAQWDAKQRVSACKALLAHYSKSTTGAAYRKTSGPYKAAIVMHPMQDELRSESRWYRIPRAANGGIAWSYKGPKNHYNNQMGQINRHGWMLDLLFAGLDDAQGDQQRVAYLTKLDDYLRDWCAHTTVHKQFLTGRTHAKSWPRPSDRKLNAGIRMRDTWPILFYSFLARDEFRDASRLLMLAAIAEHGQYLRQHHAPKGNHMMMELTGLATLVSAFPEFKDRTARLDYVRRLSLRELQRQFYPEGVQKELCQNYHSIVVRDFEHLEQIYTEAGYPSDERVAQLIRKGWEHLAFAMKPNSNNLFFNDTNDTSLAKLIRSRADRYGRQDWLYPLSNGSEGVRPAIGPSLMYAWSGRLVSREDWSRDSQWSAFDIGPWGIGHAHSDKLHLSVYHGRDLLVDSGRYTYKNYDSADPTDWRGYVRRSWGHNVIIVDGQSQQDDVKEVKKPAEHFAVTDAYDFALGTWNRGWFGKRRGVHQRAVFFLKGLCWVVCDRVVLDQPRSIEALWHLHPECTVSIDDDGIIRSSDAGVGNIRILPVPGEAVEWDIEIVKGRTKPTIQGWYSRIQGEIVPSPCAVATASGVHAAHFAWLITTGIDTPPAYTATIGTTPDGVMQVVVSEGDKQLGTVAVDFTGQHAGLKLADGSVIENRHAVRIPRRD